jgi:hypothetical protein
MDAADCVLHYVLDAQDALAWERVSPELRKRNRLALAASFFAGLGLLKVLSGQLEAVPGLHSLPAAMILILLPALMAWLFQNNDRYRRANARFGKPVVVKLDLWADRMVEHREDQRAPLALGGRSLRVLSETAEHVFLSFGREDVVIVPARAFATPAAKQDFAAQWRAKIG